MKIGTVKEIWRYPVKSMGGETLDEVELGAGGIPGDRAWAVRDEEVGAIRGAKKLPGLMKLSASYPEPPAAGQAGAAEIRFPDGRTFRADGPEAADAVSDFLDREITLWPLQPLDKLEHYRRGAPDHEDLETELRSIFGLLPDEPLPDLSVFPPEILEYESPPGTYFDAFPLLLVTGASLARLAALTPESKIDVRRFRPNFLVDAGGDGFVEAAWVGKKLRVGEAEVEITTDCPRCSMTTQPFDDLPRDPTIMRTLVRENDQKLGVYATVSKSGRVRAGDAVEMDG